MRTSLLASRIVLALLLLIFILAPAPVSLAQEEATGEPPAPPTEIPAEVPTELPTEVPTEALTEPPTEAPTEVATEVPTEPTVEATQEVTATPPVEVTAEPTLLPELTAEATLETLLAPAPLVARVEPVTEASLMVAKVFVVNNTADFGDATPDGVCDSNPGMVGNQCSLREAIDEANATPDKDTINFNIPGTGPHTILVPAFVLPDITQPVIINGMSEPGYTWGTPQIVLKGPDTETGFWLQSTAIGSVIRGLVLQDWSNGIVLESGGNLIQANFVGTNALGTSADATTATGFGVALQGAAATNNTIGGTTAALRNVISGNTVDGVWMSGVSGNRLQGNYIGTSKTGTIDLGNARYGVLIVNGATNNTIGGTVAGARNVISGNNQHGIIVGGPGANGNLIQGNYIGTNAAGTADLGNTQDGVQVNSADNNIIGGTVAGTRNVISGNNFSGVSIYGPTATADGNLVMGNYIGTNAAGTGPLGNSQNGVYIRFGLNNIVGGSMAGAANRIAFNGNDGVTVAYGAVPTDSVNNRVLNNLIYGNVSGPGIDLYDDGPTANDYGSPPDDDNGPNYLQNYPVLTDMRSNRFVGWISSDPGEGFRLQFYASPPSYGCNALGEGAEGYRYLGTGFVFTNVNGGASFNLALPNVAVTTGWSITATATDLDGNTSEFSKCAIANLGIPALLTPANNGITYLTQPTFNWNPVPNASGYWIQIAYDPSFLVAVDGAFPSGASYTPSTPLAPGESYYWRVAAFGPGTPPIDLQVTPWSATRRLNIGAQF